MEDDSNDSSQLDDEGSDDNDSDDRSQEDLVFGEEQLERRTNSGGSQRSNLAPASMQWAIRNRDTTRQSGVRLTSSSNVVFIDPNALRRSTTSNAAVAAASQEPATMATTSSALARAFGIVLRQISELIGTLPDVISNGANTDTHCLYMTYAEAVHLQVNLLFYFIRNFCLTIKTINSNYRCTLRNDYVQLSNGYSLLWIRQRPNYALVDL